MVTCTGQLPPAGCAENTTKNTCSLKNRVLLTSSSARTLLLSPTEIGVDEKQGEDEEPSFHVKLPESGAKKP